MKAMILAAGRGSRMGPLSDNLPKPLLKVKNITLIERHILNFKNHGITDIVINVSYLSDKMINFLKDGSQYGVKLYFSIEEKLLDTGGGILNALPLLGNSNFIVVSADIYTDFSYKKLFNIFETKNTLAHLIMVNNPEYNKNGDYSITPQGLLSCFGNLLTYANIGIFNKKFFENLNLKDKSFPLSNLFEKYIAQNKISGEIYKGIWYNVGTPEELAKVNNI